MGMKSDRTGPIQRKPGASGADADAALNLQVAP
jgi:hypothetical protein